MSELIVTILILLALAFIFRLDLVWYIIYLCIGIFVWSNWFSPRAFRKLEMRRSFQDHAFLGEYVSVVLRIKNQSRIPIPWMQLMESVPSELRVGRLRGQVIALGGKKSKSITYKIKAMKRGYYRVGPSMVQLGDLFGFKDISGTLAQDYLTVYPQIIPIQKLGLPSKLPFDTIKSEKRLFADPTRPWGVRDYHPGDSLRHINWKVSAHADELLVRMFEPSKSQETSILLNLNRNEYSRQFQHDGPEWSIVVGASLAAYLSRERQAVGLITNGVDPLGTKGKRSLEELRFDETSGRLIASDPIDKRSQPVINQHSVLDQQVVLPARTGRPHLMRLLELLARVESSIFLASEKWIPLACVGLNWGMTVTVISPTGSERICQALHNLLRIGLNPILIITEPYTNFSEIFRRARLLGFQSFQVENRDHLKKHIA